MNEQEKYLRDEKRYKTAFAVAHLTEPDDPLKAAQIVFPGNMPWALKIAHEWPNDAFVVAEKLRLIAKHGELHFLPKKHELGRVIWRRIVDKKTTDDDAAKLAKIYAEMMDFIPKTKIDANVKNSGKIELMISKEDERL